MILNPHIFYISSKSSLSCCKEIFSLKIINEIDNCDDFFFTKKLHFLGFLTTLINWKVIDNTDHFFDLFIDLFIQCSGDLPETLLIDSLKALDNINTDDITDELIESIESITCESLEIEELIENLNKKISDL